jgi:hypothetical protein
LKQNKPSKEWGCHMENISDNEKTRSTSSKQNSIFFRAMLVFFALQWKTKKLEGGLKIATPNVFFVHFSTTRGRKELKL